MPNRAWAVARKLERINARPDPEMIAFVSGRLSESGHAACVVDEICHTMKRRQCGSSDIEWRGAAYRERKGLGKPFSTGNAPGKGRGYGYGR